MTGERNTPVKKLARAAIASLNDHWIIKSIIVLIPTIAAFALAFPAVQALFSTTTNTESVGLNAGAIILLVVVSVCSIIEVSSNMISSHDNRDKMSYEAEIQIRRNASVNEAIYEAEKNRHLQSGYHQIAYDNNSLVDFIKHYVNPRERTKQILTQIGKCIAGECGLESTEIVLSAVVSIDDKDWSWLCFPDFEGRGHLRELVRKGSALKQVIDERTYFFSNDKQTAINEKKYLPDRRDETNNNIGSIICWEVATMIEYADAKETHPLRMIISISTYGKTLIDSEKNKTKIDQIYSDVFKKMILNQFKGELTENLIWYGLQKLKEN